MWDKFLFNYPVTANTVALDIGGRNGGLSLYLANNYNVKVICSDLINNFDKATKLHVKYNVSHLVSYKVINVMKIDLPDASIDIVIFKSVIGALGNIENQRIAISEIYRVLKPGGIFLFAENSRATNFHMFSRKLFNKYSRDRWYYTTYYDFVSLFSKFNEFEVSTTGFFALFFRNNILGNIFSKVDLLLDKFLPKKNRYIIFGGAKK